MNTMTIFKNNLPRFSNHLWVTLGMLVVFAATFAVYAYAEKEIDELKKVEKNQMVLEFLNIS